MKLKKILSENQELNFTPKQKRAFLESISKFNEYGQSIYRTSKLKEAVSEIAGLVDMASKVAVNETGDWFDNVSVKRDMKGLSESMSVFEKTADEMGALQQRLESLYEDMGHKLGKYYEIAEKIDNIDDKEAAMDFKDLPDKDIDNDGDVDDSDSYLHHKLGNVAKRVENRMTKLAGIKEAAPKMKSSPFASKVMTQMQILSGIEQQMKFKDRNAYDKTKNDFKKVHNAMGNLYSAVRMHGSNLVK
tara:strand:- start:1416 stop:2153 length:738 start_codon:yes stop_codon:yes gene_type:complete